MKRHPRLNTAQLRHVDLLERVIDAVTHDWPPGMAYMAVSEYCARRSEIDLLELVRVRRRVQRQLGTHIYCLARTLHNRPSRSRVVINPSDRVGWPTAAGTARHHNRRTTGRAPAPSHGARSALIVAPECDPSTIQCQGWAPGKTGPTLLFCPDTP